MCSTSESLGPWVQSHSSLLAQWDMSSMEGRLDQYMMGWTVGMPMETHLSIVCAAAATKQMRNHERALGLHAGRLPQCLAAGRWSWEAPSIVCHRRCGFALRMAAERFLTCLAGSRTRGTSGRLRAVRGEDAMPRTLTLPVAAHPRHVKHHHSLPVNRKPLYPHLAASLP